MQKARGQAFPLRGMALPLLVGRWFQDLFHSPNRGSFHFSLTLLVLYRSPGSIQPWVMVHPDSSGLPRDPLYLGTYQTRLVRFRLRGFNPLRRSIPGLLRLTSSFVTRPGLRKDPRHVPRPRTDNAHGLSHPSGLGYFPFDRLYWGNRGCFLFLGVLRCFTPPGWLPAAMNSLHGFWSMNPRGLSHWEIHGSMPTWRLPVAYRSRSRPSSPPGARTSTISPL
jgi:hypothetical protein